MRENRDNRENNGNKRGFFGRLIVALLTMLAVIGIVAMAISVLSGYFDPASFPWLSFFGLAFWEILAFNIVIFLLLLLMWSRKAWVALMALLISVPGFFKSFSFGKAQDGGDLRVMSYNVQIFKDLYDEDKNTFDVANGIAQMVRENQPDVLCVQEFNAFKPNTSRAECIKLFGALVDMPYHYYHQKAYFCGNVIFSKYPLSPVKDETDFSKERDYGAVAEVNAGEKGKFLVICTHLVSFRLTKEEVTMLSEPGNTKEEVQEYGKSIISKLKSAFKRRSRQVNRLLASIPNDGRPILLCGDFNDTPLSYTYQQIKKSGFNDGFVVAGHGIGHTYAGKLPLLRIDYIWGDDEVQPMRFKRIRFKGSDHYPVMMDFNLR